MSRVRPGTLCQVERCRSRRRAHRELVLLRIIEMASVPAVDARDRVLVVAVSQLVEIRVPVCLVPLRCLVRLSLDYTVYAAAHIQHPPETHVRRRALVHLRIRRRIPQHDRNRNLSVLYRVERYRNVRHALVPLHRIVHRIMQRRRLRRQRNVVYLVQGDRVLGME